MVTREKVESFLIDAGMDFEEIGEGIWLVRTVRSDGEPFPPIVVSHAPPVLVLRSDIRRVPADEGDQLRLYRRLLELNAADLVHGAYGLEDGDIILSDTLELENLDFSEFRASVEGLSLAVSSHWQELEQGQD